MKILRLIFGIFFVSGLGMLIGSYFAIQHTRRFLDSADRAQGVVVENVYRETGSSRSTSWSYFPHVRFRAVDGRDIDFLSSSGSNPPSYSVNQTVAVLYDPQHPEHAFVDSFGSLWASTVLLVIFGVTFIAPLVVLSIVLRAGSQKEAWLRQNGRRIQAEIKGVELNASFEVNGRNPYRIICQWFDPVRNEVHVFHSKNLWFDPSEFLKGPTLEVLIDPDNPRRYTVETSFLPKVV